MDQRKPPRTTADLNFKNQAEQNNDEELDQRTYRSLVGSLLSPNKQKRPEILFRVKILATHMIAPTNQSWLCTYQSMLEQLR